ncbi:MAG TPA: diaminopimelate epimerase [Wenzhouxiangellaceae bacterium]|nr:diaminopimelate epimerase [Wenzhouxiangellaceae bacterium]
MTGPVAGHMSFFKLEALGNDFVLVDARPASVAFAPTTDAVIRLADRRTGIGFDQLLILRPGEGASLADVEIFNADGSQAEQCGNGMRAIAAWLDRAGELSPGAQLGTPAGPVELARHAHGGYTAVLPGPRTLDPEALGLLAPHLPDEFTGWALISLGNPHLILNSDQPPSPADLARIVAILDEESWRGRVNVGLMHIDSDDTATLMVHERGAGPTLACGSAACAAAWALRDQRPSAAPVAVAQPGGSLMVDLASRPGHAVTTGPATVVFEGTMA